MVWQMLEHFLGRRRATLKTLPRENPGFPTANLSPAWFTLFGTEAAASRFVQSGLIPASTSSAGCSERSASARSIRRVRAGLSSSTIHIHNR
jgi:hypothetical protein